MAYDFYFDGVRLPVTPESLKIKVTNQNKTISLLNEGEFNFLRLPGLSEVEFSMLLPQAAYPFANGTSESIDYYLSLLERLKTGKTHFQFIVSRLTPQGKLLFDTNLTVSLEEYEIREDAASLGMDTEVSVKLKQFRAYATKTIQLTAAQDGGTPTATVTQERDASTAPQPQTYTVQKGDCLWNIAKKYLGDGSRYTEIATLNSDKIINPNLIYPGQMLTLP